MSGLGRRILITIPAVEVSDSRGNRLLRYQVNGIRDSEGKRLYLYAHDETARHVGMALQGLRCARIALASDQIGKWTHRFELSRAPNPAHIAFLDLMKEVLTLNVPRDLDGALALDFYKDPSTHEDSMQWKETPAGKLVNLGKYYGYPEPAEDLAESLASVIDRHPTYRAGDVILTVPGSKNKFGERLAEAVAQKAGKPLVRTVAAHATRREAKAAETTEPLDLTGEFSISPEMVNGRVAIIVDDVYKTGRTMKAIAVAARDSGAAAVLGLVGARTMRAGGG